MQSKTSTGGKTIEHVKVPARFTPSGTATATGHDPNLEKYTSQPDGTTTNVTAG